MILSQQEQIDKIENFQKTKKSNLIEDVVESNKKMIKKIGQAFLLKNPNISKKDLYSAGIEGLLHAIRKFDSKKNNAFLPYAKLWIKVKMQEYVKNSCSSLTISGRNGRKLFSNYFRYLNELEESGIPVTTSNVAEKAKCSEYEINDFVHALFPTASLFHDFDDNSSYEERFASCSISPEEEYDNNQANHYFGVEISEFVSQLNNNEKLIWQNRCFNVDPESITKLASQLNLNSKEVSSIERKLMKRFKQKILNSPKKDLYHSLIEK